MMFYNRKSVLFSGNFLIHFVPGQRDTGTRKFFCPGTSRPVETLVQMAIKCYNSNSSSNKLIMIPRCQNTVDKLIRDVARFSNLRRLIEIDCLFLFQSSFLKLQFQGGLKPFSLKKLLNGTFILSFKRRCKAKERVQNARLALIIKRLPWSKVAQYDTSCLLHGIKINLPSKVLTYLTYFEVL